jgi:soluble lytic murein transglycosylase-like protein
VRALAWQESGYNPGAVSEQGAKGVMQLTSDTWTFVVTVVIRRPVPATADGNIHVGVAYLRYLLTRFGGSTVDAVAAYLQGPRSVELQGVLPATRIYVDDVLSLARSQPVFADS